MTREDLEKDLATLPIRSMVMLSVRQKIDEALNNPDKLKRVIKDLEFSGPGSPSSNIPNAIRKAFGEDPIPREVWEAVDKVQSGMSAYSWHYAGD